ncbi:methyltransferase [Chryseotalea sanaruensis]|uniref:Methyltransferase n=1 Tax=Chryseotalea sanaruensis TaxID=2482724 RepID=A0A401UAU2_9BACT|nr:tRNA (5-methylaminomethyl-2-thiouridine)(34)-methyltransferase MnmD [Chryseotalea sanaruensis]GCC52009.1 methyltransferase [Chryseotalea sanaruensis]
MIELITTGDGSHSLLNTSLDETYHSRHGALQESKYVFIKQGLNFFIEKAGNKQVSILEVGFGTGLNAWLTLQEAQALNISIHYTSLETYPLPKSVWPSLNYATGSEFEKDFEKLHEAEWNKEVLINKDFSLHKVEQSLQEFDVVGKSFDIIYFDAFAPNKQPELWEASILQKVVISLNPSGVFVTYCAKGQLKRDLKSFDLVVESLPGPPGKREMVRALKK